MDERFHQGIRDFNDRRFFEAHDVLEDLWHEYRELDRAFIQGLIQIAVGFYHLENGNLKGSRSQLTKGISKVERYIPNHHGIETQHFLECVKEWLATIEQLQGGKKIEYSSTDFPTIQYLKEETLRVVHQ